MTTPADLQYTPSHAWVRMAPDGTAAVGITFHAQEQLGDVVFVQPPDVGRVLAEGEQCGAIESVKAASDIFAPVSGEVIATNAELEDAPQRLNEAPYEAWIYRLRPSDPAEQSRLLDAAAYEQVAAADQA
jgi:glycine cleavage system H protein